MHLRKWTSFILLFFFSQAFSMVDKDGAINPSRWDMFAELVYLKPTNDLKYAVFVSGTQPFFQSWENQVVDTDYSPGFELGLNYNFAQIPYQTGISWLHLNTKDSASKQAARNTDLINVQFVAPPYEVGPPVFAIKQASSTIKNEFDSINLKLNRLFEYNLNTHANVFAGINVLHIEQTETTIFQDNAGSPATPYSYALSADPTFYVQSQNSSKYWGAGPSLGLKANYLAYHHLGIMGEALGSLTAGRSEVSDQFTGNSSRLISLGLGPTHQSLTTPDSTQVVAGFDGKLGLFYDVETPTLSNLRIELGYRLAFYNNAIGAVNPVSLVQAGTVVTTPEFATGTMALSSTASNYHNFSFNGPFLNFRLLMA